LNPDEVRSWKFFGAERPACLVFTLVVRRRRWIGREVSCDVVGGLGGAAASYVGVRAAVEGETEAARGVLVIL
jgi:hypothetical protein